MKCTYILDGLDCPSCAMKIEEKIRKIEELKEVNLNFTTQILSFEGKKVEKEYIDLLQKEIDQIEYGIVVAKRKEKVYTSILTIKKENTYIWIRLGVGGAFFLLAIMGRFIPAIEIILFLVGYITIGGDVLYKAGRNILKGHLFDENLLMSIATIGAMLIGEYPEGVAVMLFYQIGELFQNNAVGETRKSIAKLMDIRPDVAWIKDGESLLEIRAENIKVGQVIVIKPGERIPLDGIVLKGESFLDMSALTGESVPSMINEGEQVLSGVVNQTSVLEVKVTKVLKDSTVSRILELVEHATDKKAKTEAFITKFAKYYTPVVVYLALALAIVPPLLIEGAMWQDWIHRSLVFLVISCPCALVISIPLGFFGGIGGASSHGILIKGSDYLESLNQITTIVFDKTGTLTKGDFKVISVKSEIVSEDELLGIAATMESQSTHPIALSIVKAYGKSISNKTVSKIKEVWGKGIEGKIDNEKIVIGNAALMEKHNISYEKAEDMGTIVYVAKENQYIGCIIIGDEIKEDSRRTIRDLRKQGIDIIMLTGDRKKVGEDVGRSLGIDIVHTELLPHDKVDMLEEILEERGEDKVIFVGDGLNDAPVLARASIGIAMGGIGSDAAIEAADIVLMTDEPSKLVDAFKIAKKTKNIVWQNIFLALSVKGIVLLLGAMGLATMWAAVFADVGVALIAIINAIRIIRHPL